MDLLTVHTLTFKTLYVLVLIAHARRKWTQVAVTAPAAAWVQCPLVEATPWGRRHCFLLRDRESAYGRDFAKRAAALSIETLLAPARAPQANAVAERVIGTLQRECLDYPVVLNGECHGNSLAGQRARAVGLGGASAVAPLQTPPVPR